MFGTSFPLPGKEKLFYIRVTNEYRLNSAKFTTFGRYKKTKQLKIQKRNIDKQPTKVMEHKPAQKDPLHGVKLADMLAYLVEKYGWREMGRIINIRCFNYDPSIKSSLHFLRRTPWARQKVEEWYKHDHS